MSASKTKKGPKKATDTIPKVKTESVECLHKKPKSKTIPLVQVSKKSSSKKTDKTTNLFFAEVTKGYIPKTTFDALATSLSRITLRLTKKGLFIRDSDDCEDVRWAHVLWDVDWPRKKFKIYKCAEQMTVTLNAKHLQKMLRNVKKKDTLTFFIRKSDRTQLGIIIQPAGSQSDGPAARLETVYLNIQHVNSPLPLLPEMYLDENGDEKKAYGNPMIIGATDFQKIKKMAGTVTTLIVKMQRNNYISFHAGDENVMCSHLEFGQLTMKPDDSSSESSSGDSDDDISGDHSNESSDESSESEEESPSDEEGREYSGMYEKTFTMSLFVPLIKLPGLTQQMEFYAPKANGFPLKVSMSATSGLGDISVFIKDQQQILIDEEKRIESVADTPAPVPRGKGKK